MDWYCKRCGFGPHSASIHSACIECGHPCGTDSVDRIASLERSYIDLEAQDHGGEIRAANENTDHVYVSLEGSTGAD
ncbi:hypothetical protein K440DRAFT_628042 [Wilcoxina mikolae CBS 423.85]|nr:hypothetical protein K440DRAFT_628042 [Wilcoxina mikolae CBS 423.85]